MRASIRTGASVVALMIATVGSPAWAQQADTSTDEELAAENPADAVTDDAAVDGENEAIIVTGSRLATGFSMPTPVSVVTSDQMQKTAPNSMAESLRQIPALSTSVLASNSGSGSGVSQTNGQSLLNLRGLGANRTLVLLDGARLGVTNVVNSVDINIIPQELIKRVDVVTGGASASYGSDAVSGVVNFILDTKFEGLKMKVSAGSTFRGDAGNMQASLAFGKALGERGRIVGSAEIFRSEGIRYGYTGRDWVDEAVGQWPNAIVGATPTSLTLAGVRSSNATYGGVITAVTGCPTGAPGNSCRLLANQQFLTGGAISTFNPGTSVGSQFSVGGDGALVTNGLSPEVKREAAFLHAEYDVADNVTAWVQGTYSRSWTNNEAQIPVQNLQTPFRIYEGNAYLPSAVASVFAATPGTQSFTLSRYDPDLGYVTVRGETTVKRGAVGLKGSLGGEWSFDSALAYQSSVQNLDIYNTIQRNLYAASDAVINPATNQVVCRSTFFTANGTFVPGGTGVDVGCVPMNLFGPGSISPEAANYVMGWNTAEITLNQISGEANFRGKLPENISLGAGAISVAVGAGYRKLTADRKVDSLSAINIDFTGLRVCNATSTPACTASSTSYPTTLQGRYGGYQFYNPSPLSGEVQVYEGYGELGIPILKDKPLVESLDLTLAGRYTHYSQSGWEPTWKVGLNWTVNPDLRFRGTYSADSRAPSVTELFNTAAVTQGRNRVPCLTCTASIVSGGQNIALGNASLTPEKARTLTGGFVFTPGFIPGLQASVDYYKISLKDSIIALGPQNIVDLCYGGDANFCSQITVNGNPITTTNGITAADFVVVYDRLTNYAQEDTSGIDMELAYKFGVGSGTVGLNLNGNYLLHARLRTGCATVAGTDLVGYLASCGATFGAFPRVRARLGVNYQDDHFGLYVQERYISGGKKNPTLIEGTDITENDVPATWYTDLNLTFNPEGRDGRFEMFFQITNLLDQEPRATLVRSRSWIEPSDLSLYDAIGRRFVTGVRIKI